MTEELKCWKCGSELSSLPQPLSRRAECPACHAELHACRMCRHYDTAKAKHCREPVADEVKDKARANFCDWFQPTPQAYHPPGPKNAQTTRSELDALFGAGPNMPNSPDTARRALDDLFNDAKD